MNARGDVVESTGLIFAMLDELAGKLNFSYVVVPPEDGAFGIKVDGKWNGMIGQMVRKEVFMGAAAFTISADRNQASV